MLAGGLIERNGYGRRDVEFLQYRLGGETPGGSGHPQYFIPFIYLFLFLFLFSLSTQGVHFP